MIGGLGMVEMEWLRCGKGKRVPEGTLLAVLSIRRGLRFSNPVALVLVFECR